MGSAVKPPRQAPVDVQPDVTIDPKSEQFSDDGTILRKIGSDALQIVQGGDAVALAQRIKADADLGIRICWGH